MCWGSPSHLLLVRIAGVLGRGSRAGGDSGYVERCRVERGVGGGEGGRAIAEVQLVHEGSHCFLCQRSLGRLTAGESAGQILVMSFSENKPHTEHTSDLSPLLGPREGIHVALTS